VKAVSEYYCFYLKGLSALVVVFNCSFTDVVLHHFLLASLVNLRAQSLFSSYVHEALQSFLLFKPPTSNSSYIYKISSFSYELVNCLIAGTTFCWHNGVFHWIHIHFDFCSKQSALFAKPFFLRLLCYTIQQQKFLFVSYIVVEKTLHSDAGVRSGERQHCWSAYILLGGVHQISVFTGAGARHGEHTG
jgi:hypothetical protein